MRERLRSADKQPERCSEEVYSLAVEFIVVVGLRHLSAILYEIGGD